MELICEWYADNWFYTGKTHFGCIIDPVDKKDLGPFKASHVNNNDLFIALYNLYSDENGAFYRMRNCAKVVSIINWFSVDFLCPYELKNLRLVNRRCSMILRKRFLWLRKAITDFAYMFSTLSDEPKVDSQIFRNKANVVQTIYETNRKSNKRKLELYV